MKNLSQQFLHILLRHLNHLVEPLHHLVVLALDSHRPCLYQAGLVEVRGLEVGSAEPGLQGSDVSGHVPQEVMEKEEGDGVQGEDDEKD